MNVGFIGAGNMGGALARAISADKQTNIYIYDANEEKANTLANEIGASFATLDNLLSDSDFIFLGVKPNVIIGVCESIESKVKDGAAVISMAAGVKVDKLSAAIGSGVPVIRIMPNTPVTVGAGMTAWCKNAHVTEDMAESFKKMMAYTGALDELPEDKIDSFCAIAGCGPAYAYMFIDALAKAGVECGLDYDRALFYASKMLSGSALMAQTSPLSPEVLCKNVCSPGGSTIEGVKVLEAASFANTVGEAIAAAYKRTKELGN